MLNTLFPEESPGWIAVWHKSNKMTSWFQARDVAAAEAYMKAQAANDDVYFGWGLQREKAASGRGSSDSVVAVPGVMMDIDLKSKTSGVHAEENLPLSSDEVVSFINEISFIMPTQFRHSGNGLYGDWLYPELWCFGSDEERIKAAEISKRLQCGLLTAAKELRGWKLDNTSDLARVTRMPGTKNHKTNPPKDVTLLDLGSGKRYSIEELESAIADLEKRFVPLARSKRSQSSRKPLRVEQRPVAANDNAPSFESIATACAWVEHLVTTAERMPEPDWYALASIAGRCEDGENIFHEISAQDSRYNREETQSKLDHAIKSAGPRTCRNISERFEGCRDCPFFDRILSPVNLGYLSTVQASLMSRYVFDVASQCYIEIETGKSLDDRQFRTKHRHETGDTTPDTLLLKNRLTRKVDRSEYVPGNERRFLKREGEDIFNTWRPCGVGAELGDASIILDHLEYLFGQTRERDHFLNCLASLVQRPADKIKHVLLIIGKQGTGKSFLARLLENMVGKSNVKIANSDVLISEWTENLLDCQVLVLEEVMTKGRKEVYNRMKTWVTDETSKSNQKNKRIRDAATPRLVIAFSNHPVPVSLESGDRRFFVVRRDVEPRDKAYYARLFGEGMSQVPAFLHHLKTRDISSFHPSAHPPVTDAKEELIADALPRAEVALRELIDRDDPMLKQDVLPFSRIKQVISFNVFGVTDNQVKEALRAIGAVSLGQVRLGNGCRERLWAIRNVERWKVASPDDLRTYVGTSRA